MGSPIGFSGGGATRDGGGRKDESSGHGRGVQAWRWWLLLGSRLEVWARKPTAIGDEHGKGCTGLRSGFGGG
ncbi:hypothetical protein M0R45_036131 [Rubus argutus]|uniref:Uncharacterized protein n=1 Tax=Rubus argutus TaxID=59490 RepID=A0AAW1VWY2_RUBAR